MFENIPIDVELLILPYLLPENFANIALTNSEGRALANNDKVWETLAQIHFPHHLLTMDEFDKKRLQNNYRLFCQQATFNDYPDFTPQQKLLFAATKQGSVQLADVLAAMHKAETLKTDLTMKDVNEYTPLMWAMAKNHVEAMQLLKAQNATITCSKNALLFAAKNNHLAVVREIFNTAPDLAPESAKDVFCFALSYGYLEMVKYIVEHLTELKLSLNELIKAKNFASSSSEIIDYLLTQKHSQIEADNINAAFLEVAEITRKPDILKLFLTYCDIPQSVQIDGLINTALQHKLSRRVKPKIIDALFQFGNIDIEKEITWGFIQASPIEILIKFGSPDAVIAVTNASKMEQNKIYAYYKKVCLPELDTTRFNEIQDKLFHEKMQNPQDGIIDLSSLPLKTENLRKLNTYFIKALNGHFLFDKPVHTLNLSGINFHEKNHSFGYSRLDELCEFLKCNPAITTLNLSNTDLDDFDCDRIYAALQDNVHLKYLVLLGNPEISPQKIKLIKARLEKIKQNTPTFDSSMHFIDYFDAENNYFNFANSHFSDADIPDLCRFLANRPDIKSVNLSNTKITDLGISLLAENTTLRELNLSKNKIGKIALKTLARNTTLESLNLSSCDINDDDLVFFAENTTVKILDLSSNNLHAKGIKAFAKNGFLETLNLNHNKIGNEGANLIETNTSLKNLKVAFNLIDVSIKKLASTNLISLDISGNRIDKEAATAFAKNNKLVSLDVSNTEMNDEVATILAQNIFLKALNIQHNEITELAAKAFAENTSLESLDISNNQLGNKGAKQIAQNTRLKKLVLRCNHISNASCFAEHPSLQTLDLGLNCISDATAFENSPLEILDLSFNCLGDKSGNALGKNKNLKKLYLNHNTITHLGIQTFADNKTLLTLETSNNQLGKNGTPLALANNTALEYLDISENGLGDQGAIIFANNTTLKHLRVNKNDLTDITAIALAENSTLISLYINDNSIRDKGAIALALNKNLDSLCITFNKFGDNAASALANNTNLKWLNLRFNRFIDDEGYRTLSEVNPIKRTNYARQIGIPTNVPTLARMSIFSLTHGKNFLQQPAREVDALIAYEKQHSRKIGF